MTDEELETAIENQRKSVEIIQSGLLPDDDPWESKQAQELLRLERIRSSRALNKLHPGDRFRLMFGQAMKSPKFKVGDQISLRKWDQTVPPWERLGDSTVTSIEPWQSESGWRVEFKTRAGPTYALDQNWLEKK